MKLTLCVSEAVTVLCQGSDKIAKGTELEFYATGMEVVLTLIVFLEMDCFCNTLYSFQFTDVQEG